jgi:release factor glutamine methyltransferase
MKIEDLLLEAESRIERLDAEVLLAHILRKDREWLFTHPDSDISEEELGEFEKLVEQIESGKPVAYLTGSKEFFGLDFFVDENVLVPRPETELLIEEILKIQPKSILDVGTGSGCIAITMKKNLPHCEVLACDISPAAIEIAKRNARRHEAGVKFFESDLLGDFDNNVDLIVANLPYVPENAENIQKSVKEYEPHLALFAGEDGLDLIRKLLQQIADLSEKPKYVLLEIGIGQADILSEYIESVLPGSQIDLIKDLAGIERVVKIQLN